MNYFNQDHEAIINVYAGYNGTKKDEGKIVDHYQRVNNVSIMLPISENTFRKVELTKRFILDLANEIHRIEAEKVKMEYAELPF